MPRTALIYFTLLLLPLSSFAAPLNYQLTADWEKPRRLDLLELKESFAAHKLFALDRKNFGRMKWISVDQIFASPELRQVIFLKMGLKPSDSSLMNKVIKGSEGSLYHGQGRDGNPFALFFVNLSDRQIQDVINGLPKKSELSSRLLNIFWPYAYADTIAHPYESPPSVSEVSGQNILASGVGTCLNQAADGAVGAASDTWKAARQLVTDPWGFWGSVKDKFAQFKELLANMNEEIDGLMNTLSTIDRDTALAVACSIAGQAAFAALLTAGMVGAAKGVATLAKVLLQLKTFRSVFEQIARLRAAGKIKSHEIPGMVSGVMSCAI